MRTLRSWLCRMAVVSCLAAVGACAAAGPLSTGTVPGLQPDGTYVLTDAERSKSCRHAADLLEAALTKMEALPAEAKKQRDQPPSTIAATYARLTGSADDKVAAEREFALERARVGALQTSLVEQRCPVLVDYGARLASLDKAMAAVH